MKNLGHVPGKFVRYLGMRKQPDELSGTTVLEKIFSINISWRSYPQWVRLLIGPRTRGKMTITSMRKVCMLAFFIFGDRIQTFFDPQRSTKKMPSVMPFTFNAVELCVATINEKTWTRAKEVCKALQ